MQKTITKNKKVIKKKTSKKKEIVKLPKIKNLGYVKIDMSTMKTVEGRGTVYTFRKIP